MTQSKYILRARLTEDLFGRMGNNLTHELQVDKAGENVGSELPTLLDLLANFFL